MNSQENNNLEKIYDNWKSNKSICKNCQFNDYNNYWYPLYGLGNTDSDVMVIADTPAYNLEGMTKRSQQVFYETHEIYPDFNEFKDKELNNRIQSKSNVLIQVLRKMSMNTQYAPESMYFTNVKKCGDYPNISDITKTNGYDVCKTYIPYEIEHVKPKIIIIIGGIKKPIKINGLDQLNTEGIEFANAKLLNTPNGYYIALTTYISKNKLIKNEKINETIGIDFGCSTSFTLSNGEKFNVFIGESERLKTLQRKIARQKKGSNNRYKTIHLLKKEYQKLDNQKNDVTNKLIHNLSSYEKIVIQDEQLNKWKIKNGKKIQHSILGRVKSKIIKLDNAVILNKYVPTTKFCHNCGSYVNMGLNQRTFMCNCGIKKDRDIHAAQNMVWFYNKNIGVGRTDFKHVELKNLISKVMKHEDTISLV